MNKPSTDLLADINAALYEIEEAAADLVGQVESLAAEEDAQHLHALVKSLAKTVNDGRLAGLIQTLALARRARDHLFDINSVLKRPIADGSALAGELHDAIVTLNRMSWKD